MGFFDILKDLAEQTFSPKELNQGEDDWIAGYNAGERDAERTQGNATSNDRNDGESGGYDESTADYGSSSD